ncbi:MAG: hypothetical protein MUQ56_09430, partial [Thermoleophilia bacterium]|nr:hypothetical protein [Thermoleophilia bacterium]
EGGGGVGGTGEVIGDDGYGQRVHDGMEFCVGAPRPAGECPPVGPLGDASSPIPRSPPTGSRSERSLI